MSEVNMTWVVAPAKPRWLASAAMAPDGTVFVPAAYAGDEHKVKLCAVFDGETILEKGGHIYVPSGWLAREYPDTADLCELIGRRVKALTVA